LTSAIFSPDGKNVLTTSSDRTARLWDVASGKEVRRFEGKIFSVSSAIFSPDGTRVLTACDDKTSRIWDVASGRETCRFEGHGDGVTSAIYSPDGKTVLTASDDMTARLWDVASCTETRRLVGHGDGVTSAAFSPDGTRVLTVSRDKTARLWDVASGKEVRRFEGHGGWVTSATFSPDGKSVLTASNDNTARLWDVASGKETRRLEGHEDAVQSAVFSPDGTKVLTASWDNTARIWDAASGKEARRFAEHIESAVFSSDGKRVLTASFDKTARIWDLESGNEIRRFEGHEDAVQSAIFSQDGTLVVTASKDNTARIWVEASGDESRRLGGRADSVSSAIFSSDGKLVLTASFDKTARIWDLESGNETSRLGGLQVHVTSAVFSPDGNSVLTANDDRTARIWDLASGKETRRFEGHEGAVTSGVFSPDGTRVLTAGEDRTARIWDVASGKETRRFGGHEDAVQSAIFSPDGKTVLTASWDKTARIWDVASGKEIQRFGGHEGAVQSAIFSSDGKTVLTASWDSTARIWDVGSGNETSRFEGHEGAVQSAIFSSEGKTVLTASYDGTSRIWDTTTRKELCALISYRDGSWAVVDPRGRYDSSENGHNPNLYWVFEAPAKGILDPIDVDQFSNQFYTSRLFARVMRSEELPPVPDLKNPQLFPSVHEVKVLPLTPQGGAGGRVAFGLVARGGGIGTARVLVDGQEVAQVQGKEGKNEVSVPVPIAAGAKVDVIAFNEDDSLASPRGSEPTPPRVDLSTPTRYFAVVAGVNDYPGSLPDLGFAVEDALAIVKSVQTLARGLQIEPEIYLLTNDPSVKAKVGGKVTILPATRSSVQDVLTEIIPSKGAWRQSDMLFLFFAGHGTSYTQRNQKHYAYLTQDATSADMGKEDVRLQQAVTDDDLVSWLVHYLGGKKAVVIDTCAAGTALTAFSAGVRSSDPDLDRRQAVYETQRRTGVKMLFGCADDLVSYEAPEYGHGLLTWALLNSLSNDPLGNDQLKDLVLAGTLFDRVEKTVGAEQNGQQRAQQFGVRENFPLGFLDASGRKAIPFTSKVPVFGTIILLNLDPNVASDDLKLVPQIESLLATNSRGGRPQAVVYPNSVHAIKVTGGYQVLGDQVSFRVTLEAPGKEPARLKFEAPRATAAQVVVEKLLEWAATLRP